MSKLITHFNRDLGILVVKPQGQLAPDFIKEYYRNLRDNDRYPRNLKTLCITKANSYPVGISDLDELVAAMEEACEKYASLKEAFLVEDPYMTVITTLFTEKTSHAKYSSKVFSTREAAVKWLGK